MDTVNTWMKNGRLKHWRAMVQYHSNEHLSMKNGNAIWNELWPCVGHHW